MPSICPSVGEGERREAEPKTEGRWVLCSGQESCLDNTHHASNFHLLLHHTALFERKPSYIGRKIFNHLPEDIKMLQGQRLKISLTKWLSSRPFYIMDEFLNWEREEQYSQ
ncbi:hypothetical protein J6590_075493 [Homalodisca vitripennis]|nr:hypothetical protein J6590_075493 [Homalodisca vitripennis]